MPNRLHGGTTKEKLLLNHVVDGECWRWTGSKSKTTGYGKMRVSCKDRLVHRLSYETFVGPIKDGLCIDHLCFVRDCINPAHLEQVTHAENSRRRTRRITHCKQGHPYDEENTYLWKSKVDGSVHRQCRSCIRAACRNNYWKKKLSKNGGAGVYR